MVYRCPVLATRVQGIRFCPQGKRYVLLILESASDQEQGFGQIERFPGIHTDLLDHKRSQLLDSCLMNQIRMASQELVPLRIVL